MLIVCPGGVEGALPEGPGVGGALEGAPDVGGGGAGVVGVVTGHLPPLLINWTLNWMHGSR